jgi:hypothetical protein
LSAAPARRRFNKVGIIRIIREFVGRKNLKAAINYSDSKFLLPIDASSLASLA